MVQLKQKGTSSSKFLEKCVVIGQENGKNEKDETRQNNRKKDLGEIELLSVETESERQVERDKCKRKSERKSEERRRSSMVFFRLPQVHFYISHAHLTQLSRRNTHNPERWCHHEIEKKNNIINILLIL
ncbi:Protein CBG27106 [Caenorhabditis briggsae]|uniref:Protein CBG27106 n=1 Tax=Caenorhabditis briggsae TaxID=6238 RepID=B6IHI1_CAEBR|nr:Protein CBG27106 [Caenorhabditis briggsae]CAR99361.1 Protein CBG27106 [Caenorhabditis briggsae]